MRRLGHPLLLAIPFAAAVALEATLFGVFAPPDEGGHGAGHGAPAGPESLEPTVAVAAVLTVVAALAFPAFVRSLRGRAEAQAGSDALALLSASAAAIHFAVIWEHFDEFALFGILFAATAVLQLGWAALVVQRPSRAVLLIGAIGNGGVAAIWVLSRLAGLPVGPEPWTPEAIGVGDVIATVLEVALVLGALALLRGGGLRLAPRAGRTAYRALALALVALTSIALLASTGAAF